MKNKIRIRVSENDRSVRIVAAASHLDSRRHTVVCHSAGAITAIKAAQNARLDRSTGSAIDHGAHHVVCRSGSNSVTVIFEKR